MTVAGTFSGTLLRNGHSVETPKNEGLSLLEVSVLNPNGEMKRLVSMVFLNFWPSQAF
jgi:hypothetical protein